MEVCQIGRMIPPDEGSPPPVPAIPGATGNTTSAQPPLASPNSEAQSAKGNSPLFLGKTALLFFKIFSIVVIALILLIPLIFVRETLAERQQRYNEAVSSITAPWGGNQQIIGPILVVPFTYKVESEEWNVVGSNRIQEKKSGEVTREAFFLPDRLVIEGTLTPSERSRSIYTAHVFTTELKISGRFDKPNLSFVGHGDIKPQWDRARVCFMISDLRGVRESLQLNWSGTSVDMQPGDALYSGPGLHARLPAEIAQNGGEFSLVLNLNGSDSLMAVPLARSTKMDLTSTWSDPSFIGAYLPVEREVSAKGFKAHWEASYYAREVPQHWEESTEVSKITPNDLAKGSFGVRIQPAISAYRIVERAIKYGILFVALVFTVFFLFETLAGTRLNGLNYILAGATLCVFFLGLLALSEFVCFGIAYAISGGIATLMLSLYCAHILNSRKRALTIGLILGGVYAYLYFVLRMEDFALIAGTAAVFAMLGAIMYATRNIRG